MANARLRVQNNCSILAVFPPSEFLCVIIREPPRVSAPFSTEDFAPHGVASRPVTTTARAPGYHSPAMASARFMFLPRFHHRTPLCPFRPLFSLRLLRLLDAPLLHEVYKHTTPLTAEVDLLEMSVIQMSTEAIQSRKMEKMQTGFNSHMVGSPKPP